MITTLDLASSLHGLGFPCDKVDLIEYASSHGATPELMALLQRLPERRFNSVADLWITVGGVS